MSLGLGQLPKMDIPIGWLTVLTLLVTNDALSKSTLGAIVAPLHPNPSLTGNIIPTVLVYRPLKGSWTDGKWNICTVSSQHISLHGCWPVKDKKVE